MSHPDVADNNYKVILNKLPSSIIEYSLTFSLKKVLDTHLKVTVVQLLCSIAEESSRILI